MAGSKRTVGRAGLLAAAAAAFAGAWSFGCSSPLAGPERARSVALEPGVRPVPRVMASPERPVPADGAAGDVAALAELRSDPSLLARDGGLLVLPDGRAVELGRSDVRALLDRLGDDALARLLEPPPWGEAVPEGVEDYRPLHDAWREDLPGG